MNEPTFKLYYASTTLIPNDIYPMQYGEEQCSPDHSFGPAIRNNYFLHYVYDGTGELIINKKIYKLHKGQMFIIYPGQLGYYKADNKTPWFYRWIEFNGNFSDKILKTAGFTKQNPVLNDYGNNVIGESLKAISDAGDVSFECIMSYLWKLVAALTHGNIETNHQNKTEYYINAADNYIRSNLHKKIRISDLADFLCINRSYLSRMFKSEKGMSTQQYIIKLKLNTASQYLLNKSISVKEIASSVGYDNQFEFSKAFKAKFGSSPTKWRDQKFWQQSINTTEQ